MCLCVPEPESLENDISPTGDTLIVPTDDHVTMLGAEKPVDYKSNNDRKFEIKGQAHAGKGEGHRSRSSSGSSYDSEGEKNEGSYSSPDFADREDKPDDLTPTEELRNRYRERSNLIGEPEDDNLDNAMEKEGYSEPYIRDLGPLEGETDLDAVPPNGLTFDTNLYYDDDNVDDKERPDENFNVTPRSPKRKYQSSSSESEPENESDKYSDDDDDIGRCEIEGTPDDGDLDEDKGRKKTDSDEGGDRTANDSDIHDDDEKKSRSSASDDEEKFEGIIDNFDDVSQDDDSEGDDEDKPGETNV